jgi:threonine aldolase
MFAQRVGKEAALFVPSGTMANQIAVRLLADPGTIVLAGRRQHVVAYEDGAAARNAGVQLLPLDDRRGILDPVDVASAVEASGYHQPRVSLLCVENTHMAACGAPWQPGALEAVRSSAPGIPMHMDGARLFNAEVATGIPACELAGPATTVMSCLSKGLCAPVGSVLAGPRDLIETARVERRRLGGGMRQAGVLAAAGLIALEKMTGRLSDDHERARRLAEVVAQCWPEIGFDPGAVTTNIVVFSPPDAAGLLHHLRAQGVLGGAIAPGVVRLVTHHDVDDEGVARACRALRQAGECT